MEEDDLIQALKKYQILKRATNWHQNTKIQGIFIGPRCPWGPIYGSGCLSLTDWLSYLCADLTDVTLADEDTNSILTDNANRAIQGNVAMQVVPSGG